LATDYNCVDGLESLWSHF